MQTSPFPLHLFGTQLLTIESMALKRTAAATVARIARFSSPSVTRTATAAAAAQQCIALSSTPSTPSAPQLQQHLGSIRFAHTIPRPNKSFQSSESSSDPESSQSSEDESTRSIRKEPHYLLTFTCKPCGERSRHTISKQGYHHGSVLVACPGCRNRHVISDHLKIFGDRSITVEDLLRERGQLVKKGTLGEDSDIEFWEDGTTSVHEPMEPRKPVEPDTRPPGFSFKSVKPGEKKEGEE